MLLKVTVCATLDESSAKLEKVSVVGVTTRFVAVPTPERLTLWELLWIPLMMVSEPLRFPVAVGVNTTLIVQAALAASVLGQLLVWAKSPEVWMLERFKVALPVFVSDTGCTTLDWLSVTFPNATVLGDTASRAATPVPDSVTECGLPAALSETVRLPLRVPSAVGVKTTVIVQAAPADRVLEQLLVWLKSPLIWRLLTVKVAFPAFVRVTD